MLVGTFCSFVYGIFNPYVVNKAGPDWMWGGGRNDVLRNLYFRPNGSFRRYGRIALLDPQREVRRPVLDVDLVALQSPANRVILWPRFRRRDVMTKLICGAGCGLVISDRPGSRRTAGAEGRDRGQDQEERRRKFSLDVVDAGKSAEAAWSAHLRRRRQEDRLQGVVGN